MIDRRSNSRLWLLGLAAIFGSALGGSAFGSTPAKAPNVKPEEIIGTIVSVRGSILVVRPQNHPKLIRLAVGAKTEIAGDERVDQRALKPGLMVVLGGSYSAAQGFAPRFLEVGTQRIGWMARRTKGVEIDPKDHSASCSATIKSVSPFVFTDELGKDHTASLSRVRGIWQSTPEDIGSLLIGQRIFALGVPSSDGVLTARSISPEHGFSRNGTMFGTVLETPQTIGGRMFLSVRPRFTTDTLSVACRADGTWMRQINLDPDSVTVGQTVTVWGFEHNHPWDRPRTEAFEAIALFPGNARYPAAATGTSGGVFKTGRLTSLDPVTLALPDGKDVPVVIPGQLIVARLETIAPTDLKAGDQTMLVLTRRPNGSFSTDTVIQDAPPFVGYGN